MEAYIAGILSNPKDFTTSKSVKSVRNLIFLENNSVYLNRKSASLRRVTIPKSKFKIEYTREVITMRLQSCHTMITSLSILLILVKKAVVDLASN